MCVCARLLAECSVSLFTATKYKLAPVNHSSHGCTSSSDVWIMSAIRDLLQFVSSAHWLEI